MTGPALVDGWWRLLVDGVATPDVFPTEAAAVAEHYRLTSEALAEELACLSGMACGVAGYNDSRGWGLDAPAPCGHHCRDCPRCDH